MKRVGIIGSGKVATPVIERLLAREIAGWTLTDVLARSERRVAGFPVHADPERFLNGDFDLIIEAAGPGAMRQHGLAALARADVWSVGGAALSDPAFHAAVEASGHRHRHRLRLLGPLPAAEVAALACVQDGEGDLGIVVSRPSPTPGTRLTGTVEEVARLMPDDTNFAVAAALAGPGLTRTILEVIEAGPEGVHRLTAVARGPHGLYSCEAKFPSKENSLHPLAAALIVNLRREAAIIWAG